MWPGALLPRSSYGGHAPACVVGALVVARLDVAGLLGHALAAPTSSSMIGDPALDAVLAVLHPRGVQSLTDVMRWSDRLRFLARRRAVRVLRLAARRCRRG